MTSETLYTIFKKHPRVCTDTRKIQQGDLFFALKGAHFNGNHFAAQALEKGAAYAVIDEPLLAKSDRYILVDNVLEALQNLARYHRRQLDIPVLAITGSNGKTTTKELVYLVLNQKYATHYTRGNLNNHIGVPLTLLAMPDTTELAVIEMGANHRREIAFLCTIAEPTHGLITNIGKAHLEGFGGVEGVKIGKSELYRHLEVSHGTAFVNTDEDFLPDLVKGVQKIVPYGQKNTPHPMRFLEANPMVKVQFADKNGIPVEVHSQLIGAYNFGNIMTAIAVGQYFDVPPQDIKAAVESYLPTDNRSQVLRWKSNTVILDAYNANPTSVRHALTNFANIKGQKKWLVLGDMLEMGVYAQPEHEDVLRYALRLGFDKIITVGDCFFQVKTSDNQAFKTFEELQGWWSTQVIENTHILLKGSRGIGVERLVQEKK